MLSLEMVKADKSHMVGTTAVWRNSNDSQPLAVLTISLEKKKRTFYKAQEGTSKLEQKLSPDSHKQTQNPKPPKENNAI